MVTTINHQPCVSLQVCILFLQHTRCTNMYIHHPLFYMIMYFRNYYTLSNSICCRELLSPQFHFYWTPYAEEKNIVHERLTWMLSMLSQNSMVLQKLSSISSVHQFCATQLIFFNSLLLALLVNRCFKPFGQNFTDET